MIFKGPNIESTFTQKLKMNFEDEGNPYCIKEFKLDVNMRCVLMVVKGKAVLNRCLLSLNGVSAHLSEKIPCIAGFQEASFNISNSYIFGDSYNEAIT